MKINLTKTYFHRSNRISCLIAIYFWLSSAPMIAVERLNNLSHFGVGARAIGFNNAYTASCNDYTAPFWNPAAMDFFTTVKIGGMQEQMSLNREMSFLSFVFPTEKYGALALAWAGFGIEDIEARTSNTEQPDSYFNANENTFFLSYAYRFFSFLSFGWNIKRFDYSIHNTEANGWGIDLALFGIPTEKLKFGFMIQDFNSQLRWQTHVKETFSKTYRIGICYQPFSNLSFSSDLNKMNNQKVKATFAAELCTLKIFKLRCGVDDQRLSGGVGFAIPIKKLYLNFNYSVTSDRLDAGVSDVFDLSVVF